MRHAVRFACTMCLATLCAFAPALADVPTEMNIQGLLTDNAGAPVAAGLKNFTFKIYDAAAGGVEIWPAGAGETQALVTDANGLWNGSVGTLIPLTEAVFQSPVRWLEVTVDDGINPAEVLPRIELNTVPYTYRAATSQQADSLGGMSLGDLMDKFVDEAADTMSGQLRIDWDHTETVGATVEIDNLNDGYFPHWSTDFGTWGLASDISSDNALWNIGVGSYAEGMNTLNVGCYGIADGSNSTNYGVYGIAQNGTTNWAGYFDGDLVVTGASAGDDGVQLPPNAISATEILNEPGIASNRSAGEIFLGTAAMADIVTVSITIPTDGYIKLDAQANTIHEGTLGLNQAWYQIDETAGGSYSFGYFSGGGESGYSSTATSQYSLYLQRVFYKTAGTYTFRLEGQAYSANAVGAVSKCRNAILTATFYPTSYGSVTTIATAGDENLFETATESRATTPSGAADGSSESVYLIDLRELELKAAKAEAVAEKARRELAEAQLGAIRRPGLAPGVTAEDQKQ